MWNIMNETVGELSEHSILTLIDKNEHNKISKEVLNLLAKYQLSIADVSAIFNCAMIILTSAPVNISQAAGDTLLPNRNI